MADDDSVIIPGGNPGTELLPVRRLKVFLRGNEDVCSRIQPQEIAAPLLRQMVRHHIQIFLRQSQTLALHARRYHLERLSSAHTMGQQGIMPVEDMGHSVFLMGH